MSKPPLSHLPLTLPHPAFRGCPRLPRLAPIDPLPTPFHVFGVRAQSPLHDASHNGRVIVIIGIVGLPPLLLLTSPLEAMTSSLLPRPPLRKPTLSTTAEFCETDGERHTQHCARSEDDGEDEDGVSGIARGIDVAVVDYDVFSPVGGREEVVIVVRRYLCLPMLGSFRSCFKIDLKRRW